MNTLRVAFLMFLLTALFLLVGDLFGGAQGMILALIVAGIMNLVTYFFSDKIVLRMYGAKPVTEAEAPQLHRIIRELATAAQLPMPAVAVIPQEAPNAFATGRDHRHAVVAVTEGMLRLADENELRGVLAHEIGHVKNYDMLIGTVAATLAAAIAFLPRMFFYFGGSGDREDRSPLGPVLALAAMIVMPLVALLIRMAISRSAEYRADATGAQLAGSPLGLASALKKLDAYAHRIPMQGNEVASHLFIVNPFTARSLMNMFSTHPPIEERVKRLKEMPFTS